jgi:hypothetical protein
LPLDETNPPQEPSKPLTPQEAQAREAQPSPEEQPLPDEQPQVHEPSYGPIYDLSGQTNLEPADEENVSSFSSAPELDNTDSSIKEEDGAAPRERGVPASETGDGTEPNETPPEPAVPEQDAVPPLIETGKPDEQEYDKGSDVSSETAGIDSAAPDMEQVPVPPKEEASSPAAAPDSAIPGEEAPVPPESISQPEAAAGIDSSVDSGNAASPEPPQEEVSKVLSEADADSSTVIQQPEEEKKAPSEEKNMKEYAGAEFALPESALEDKDDQAAQEHPSPAPAGADEEPDDVQPVSRKFMLHDEEAPDAQKADSSDEFVRLKKDEPQELAPEDADEAAQSVPARPGTPAPEESPLPPPVSETAAGTAEKIPSGPLSVSPEQDKKSDLAGLTKNLPGGFDPFTWVSLIIGFLIVIALMILSLTK